MKFVSDPRITVKIRKMKERVRWQEQSIVDRGIDQTRIVLETQTTDSPEFSFLVAGDSGTGNHRGYNPQRQIAEQMLSERETCRFVLHTGDVVYLVGSSEYYFQNFIRPYREFIVGGEHPSRIAYDRMVFNFPFLPVPGNHDYYDLPIVYGILSATALPLRRLLGSKSGPRCRLARFRSRKCLRQSVSRLPASSQNARRTRSPPRRPLHRQHQYRPLPPLPTRTLYPLTQPLLHLLQRRHRLLRPRLQHLQRTVTDPENQTGRHSPPEFGTRPPEIGTRKIGNARNVRSAQPPNSRGSRTARRLGRQIRAS